MKVSRSHKKIDTHEDVDENVTIRKHHEDNNLEKLGKMESLLDY